jgi:diketogulonate reductase-like aldo/keto reductase
MEYVTLNTGAEMPMEGYGVFRVPDKKECEEMVYQAIRTGYRLIDTAACIQMKMLSERLSGVHSQRRHLHPRRTVHHIQAVGPGYGKL